MGKRKGTGNVTRPRDQHPSADPEAAENRKQVKLNTLLYRKKSIGMFHVPTPTGKLSRSPFQSHGEGAGRKTYEIFK